MRRGLASLLVGVALISASLSWAGLVMLNTVLNPQRSAEVAQDLFEIPSVQSAITDRLAGGFKAKLPDSVAVPDSTVNEAADAALNTPAVRDSISAAVADAWSKALQGIDEPVTVAGDALSQAGRDALVDQQANLDGVLPSTPDFEFELPTAGFGWLYSLRSWMERFTRITFFVAVGSAIGGFVLTPERPRVLRRLAYWSFGASAFWLFMGFAVPWVAQRVAPTSGALVTGLIEIFFGAMINPAFTLAVFGLAMLGFSFVLPSLLRQRGAAVLSPAPGQVGGAVELPRAQPIPFEQPALQNRIVPPYNPNIHGSRASDGQSSRPGNPRTEIMPIPSRSGGGPRAAGPAGSIDPTRVANRNPVTPHQGSTGYADTTPSPTKPHDRPAPNGAEDPTTDVPVPTTSAWKPGVGYLEDQPNRAAD